MTDETRETLTKLELSVAEHLTNEKEAYGSRIARVSVDASDLAALRDVLTPRVCGRCRHADTESARPGWCYCAAPMRPAQVGIDEHDRRYPFHHKAVPLDEGCKGWQAREGEGGTR